MLNYFLNYPHYLTLCSSAREYHLLLVIALSLVGMLAIQSINKCSQVDSYSDVISLLKSKGNLSDNQSLGSLAPFLDSTGLLRVGGRIKNSLFSSMENIQFCCIMPTPCLLLLFNIFTLERGTRADT